MTERPDLDALERLHEATGNYEWFFNGVGTDGVAVVWHSSGIELVELETDGWDTAAAEAEFIATSHQVMPKLIAYCRYLESKLEQGK